VPDEALPADRVAMNSRVTYEELPRGARRSVTLVYPIDADAGEGRISVLSPIGLSLLGRAPGSVVEPPMPDGRPMRIRILALERRAQGGGMSVRQRGQRDGTAARRPPPCDILLAG